LNKSVAFTKFDAQFALCSIPTIPSFIMTTRALKWNVMMMSVALTMCVPAMGGQQPRHQLHIDHWGIDQGLPHNSVGALLQSHDGFLWIGTLRGLARFDGTSMQQIQALTQHIRPLRNITSLAETPDGSIWIGTDGSGLIRLRDDSVEVDYPGKQFPDSQIRALAVDSAGTLWVGTSAAGVVAIDPPYEHTSARLYTINDGLQSNTTIDLAPGHHGEIWIASAHGGLAIIEKGRILGSRLAGEHVRNVYAVSTGADGRMLASTDFGLLAISENGPDLVFKTRPADYVNVVRLSRDGSIWAGGFISGLTHIGRGPAYEVSSRLDRQDGLSGDYVGCVLEDREGSIWIGTEDGLDRLREVSIRTIADREGILHEGTTCLAEDSTGDVWVGTDGRGVYRIHDGHAIDHFGTDEGLGDGNVTSLHIDNQGRLIIATSRAGLWTVGRHRATPLDIGKFAGRIDACERSHTGEYLVGVEHLVLRQQRLGRDPSDTLLSIPNGVIRSILEDQTGGIWVGTDGGVFTHRGGREESFGTANGLPDDFITTIFEDKRGDVWVGTPAGLVRYRKGEQNVFTAQQGLPDESVSGMVEDGMGYLWLATARGIVRVSFDDIDNVAAGTRPALRCLTFAVTDGMRSSECSDVGAPSTIRLRNGELWFCTARGIAIVDPRNLVLGHQVLTMTLESVVTAAGRNAGRSPVTLDASENSFAIRYAAPTFLHPQHVDFHYRLEGFDADWISAGSRRIAYYTNVPPGKYTFVVKAHYAAVGTDSALAYVPLTILPHFYQTIPFFVGVSLLVILIFGGSHVLRVRHAQARSAHLALLVDDRTHDLQEEIVERKRVETALRASEDQLLSSLREKDVLLKEVHHRVKNNLTVISSLLNLQTASTANSDARGVLREAASRVRSMAAIHEQLYHSDNLAAIDFQFYIENLVHQLLRTFSSSGIRTDVACKGVFLEIGVAIPCGLIVNELVTNALKYAFPGGTSGHIEVRMEGGANGMRSLTVKDDGIGLSAPIDPEKSTTLGLRLVSLLGHQLGGGITLSSGPGLTCTVTFPGTSPT
jgi:two-component sensor histidine kinase/ligand-binding sensor domain-containing protein